MKALVVGGTGPTGPFLVNGLLQRGFDVSILHRGTHEIAEIPPEVGHIHADPHFRHTLDEALAGRTFDLVIGTYGRLRFVAEAVVGKTPRFISIGGFACYRGFYHPSANFPAGMKVSVPEDAALVSSEHEQRFAYLIAATEEAVLRCHPTGAVFRYPYVYGPYQLIPREWCIIRRILDKRPYIILPDEGLGLMTHGYAANLAHAVLLAVDHPEASAGQIYNCGDEQQLTMRQVVEVIAATMDYKWEIIGIPSQAAFPAPGMAVQGTHHRVMDLYKIKNQLGYKDVVAPEEGLARTVKWYLEHPPERGSDIERALQDPFDYAAEDELVEVFRDSLERMRKVEFRKAQAFAHPYPHPKEGEAGRLRDHRNR